MPRETMEFDPLDLDMSEISSPFVTEIRDRLKNKILNNEVASLMPEPSDIKVDFFPTKGGGWHRLPLDYRTYQQYIKLYLRAFNVAKKYALEEDRLDLETFTDSFQNVKFNHTVEKGSHMLLAILQHDMNSALFPVALCAWLTTDTFRWHEVIPGMPEDFSYGLVCTPAYNKVILKMAQYVAVRDRDHILLQSGITAAELAEIDLMANQQAASILSADLKKTEA